LEKRVWKKDLGWDGWILLPIIENPKPVLSYIEVSKIQNENAAG
jgi:hypothetical protein